MATFVDEFNDAENTGPLTLEWHWVGAGSDGVRVREWLDSAEMLELHAEPDEK